MRSTVDNKFVTCTQGDGKNPIQVIIIKSVADIILYLCVLCNYTKE